MHEVRQHNKEISKKKKKKRKKTKDKKTQVVTVPAKQGRGRWRWPKEAVAGAGGRRTLDHGSAVSPKSHRSRHESRTRAGGGAGLNLALRRRNIDSANRTSLRSPTALQATRAEGCGLESRPPLADPIGRSAIA